MVRSPFRRLARFVPMLLVAALLVGWPVGEPAPHAAAKGGSLRLYVTRGDAATFVPLDPTTLADLPGPPLTFEGQYPGWAVSGDGSTLAAVEYGAGRPTVRIEVAATRAVRTTFTVDLNLGRPWLNGDGSLLVLQAPQSGGVSGVTAPSWTVYATADGSTVATIAGEGQGVTPFAFHQALLDPFGDRLYVPFVPGERLADGPLPLQIARYDLRTGRETGRAVLPNVLAGSWFRDDVPAIDVLNEARSPGIALSWAGDRLAVVDPTTGAVTVIATETMSVDRTFVPERPVGWRERLRGWLSPFARAADAKVTAGTMLGATYAPDGRMLYLSGRTVAVDDDGTIRPQGLGIQRIDLVTGEIRAARLDGIDVAELWTAPEGEALYALCYDEAWETATGPVVPRLRRLDPRTLEVQAERKLASNDWVVAAPAST